MSEEGPEGARREDVQFGCYLEPGEAKRLATYAERLQINRPNLGVLLIVRELKCRRLAKLPRWDGPAIGKRNGVRVTARANFPATKVKFATQVKRLGLGMDEAVAILFRAELSERWLARSLSPERNRS